MRYLTKFDKEYATQYLQETAFLRDKGIKQTFVKTVNGLTTYKYIFPSVIPDIWLVKAGMIAKHSFYFI